MKKLFMPDASDSNIKLVGGETTNILNLANVKYQKFIDIFNVMYSNGWHPFKVSNMKDDYYQYHNVLSIDEREVYDTILSFLIFLDSLQTNNLPSIAERVTAPEVVFVLARQAFEEALHSFSYAYILMNTMSTEEFNKIIYKWRDNKLLLERNRYIAELYDKYKDDGSNKAYLITAVANFLLEGLYFYNGFQFFHTLASRSLMVASDIQIRYIQRDEQTHCVIFKDKINIFKEENPDDWDTDLVYNLFSEAVKFELEFSKTTIGNKILGMSEQTIEDYTFYLANKRLKEIGLDPMFPIRDNPYKHLDKIAAIEDETTNRSNQFETESINYKSPEIFDGWDNFLEDDWSI